MIKASELRLGNWIMVAGTGELHPVKVTIDNLRQLISAPEYAAGVHLTTEILEKCRFVKSKKLNIYDKGKLRVAVDINTVFYLTEDKEADLIGSIFYLHELQNLYFALTGEQLQINL